MTEMSCPPEALKWGDSVRLKSDEQSKGLIVDVLKDASGGACTHFEVDWATGQKNGILHKDELLLLYPGFEKRK